MTRVRQVKASEPPRHARRNEGELGRKVAEEVPLTALPRASLVGVCFLSMTLSQRVSPAAMSTGHETVQIRLPVGFRLDSLWAETMGIDPSDTKERPLRLVAELLNRAGVAYALIGGVAVQIHTTGKSGTGASFRSPHETRMHRPLPSPISSLEGTLSGGDLA